LAYEFNHVHIKADDPGAAAEWYGRAFGFSVAKDWTREFGDRFIACDTVDGTRINISNARTGESLGGGDCEPHYGIEHFGVNVDDVDAEIERLKGLGADLLEGPIDVDGGLRIAFVKCPQNTRVELLQLPE
jgi:catechol 2,3-dioxygenase-like lactoylglutathione lyase family enzyme